MLRFICFVLLVLLPVNLLSEKPRIVLNSSFSAPYTTEEGDGIFDLVLKEAFQRLGYSLKMQRCPAERCLMDANSGAADGDVGRVLEIESLYPNLLRVPFPLIDFQDFVAFTRSKDVTVTGWKDLRPYNVGLVLGWKIFETQVPADVKSLVTVQSTEQLFDMLVKNRIDIALHARLEGLIMARQLRIEDIRLLEPPLARKKLFLYLHKVHAELLPRITAVLRTMEKDGTTGRLTRKVMARYLKGQDG